MVLSIVCLLFTVIMFGYMIFLAYKLYDLEDYVVLQFTSLVRQINKINAHAYKVDHDQQDRIIKLEQRRV